MTLLGCSFQPSTRCNHSVGREVASPCCPVGTRPALPSRRQPVAFGQLAASEAAASGCRIDRKVAAAHQTHLAELTRNHGGVGRATTHDGESDDAHLGATAANDRYGA